MKCRNRNNWQLVLLICVAAIVTANLAITLKLTVDLDKIQSPPQQRASPLPCEAIPMRFALAEPDCANKLLRAMNATSIHILPLRTIEFRFENGTGFHSENRSKEV